MRELTIIGYGRTPSGMLSLTADQQSAVEEVVLNRLDEINDELAEFERLAGKTLSVDYITSRCQQYNSLLSLAITMGWEFSTIHSTIYDDDIQCMLDDMGIV